MADNIYSKEDQDIIREAFLDLYFKNKNLSKDDFEELLKEKIYQSTKQSTICRCIWIYVNILSLSYISHV